MSMKQRTVAQLIALEPEIEDKRYYFWLDKAFWKARKYLIVNDDG